jgi:hypothetical protein
MIIKELIHLDLKIGDKLVDYNHKSDFYTIVEINHDGFVADTNIFGLGVRVNIPYDNFGCPANGPNIETTIKRSAYTKQLSRLIPL